MITRAEAIAASAVCLPASAIVVAYVVDSIGLTIAPLVVLAISLFGSALLCAWLWRRATREPRVVAAFLAIVASALTLLLWLAWPELLPTGSGPDLAHHLALIAFIERHWRLVHDVGLSVYLGEMVDYTPGAHLLVALVGAWVRRDGLHVLYPVIAATVALKAGVVFLIALRLLPDAQSDLAPSRLAGGARVPLAAMAAVLLVAPYTYFIGSFTEQSYLAQVVSELFAVTMWWALIVWDDQPAPEAIGVFAVAGTAAFLTWPVWTGPLLIVLAAILLGHLGDPIAHRVRQAAIGVIPIAIAAAMHTAAHVGGLRMAGTGGFVIQPDIHLTGRWFPALSIVGLFIAAMDRRARTVAVFVGALAAQAAALAVAARWSRAAAPYLAIKMFYLAIYPLAIAGALAIGAAWRLARQASRDRLPASLPWVLVAIAVLALGRAVVLAPKPKPVITQPVFLAAVWARERVAPECIDYLSTDGYTAYWLHLALFGNPRAAGRGLDDDTFEPKRALVRWIMPEGLPYAITEDFSALPRDIRESVDIAARFGPAAVVKRRGQAACAP